MKFETGLWTISVLMDVCMVAHKIHRNKFKMATDDRHIGNFRNVMIHVPIALMVVFLTE